MRRTKKLWLIISAGIFAASLLLSVTNLIYPLLPASKLFSTTSALAALVAILQLDVAGLFEKLMSIYGDDKEFPYGPPSHITREVIDNPDTPIRSWIKAKAFFDPATGYWLAIISILLAVIGTWA